MIISVEFDTQTKKIITKMGDKSLSNVAEIHCVCIGEDSGYVDIIQVEDMEDEKVRKIIKIMAHKDGRDEVVESQYSDTLIKDIGYTIFGDKSYAKN